MSPGKQGPADEAPPRFPVAVPTVQDALIGREYVAEIRAARHAEVRSRFKGVLEKVAVDEGQQVKTGQVLFAVNSRALEQELLVARASALGADAELSAAKLELANTQLLRDKNVVSAAELAMATSKMQLAKAKVEEGRALSDRAAVELGFANVRAPFDGVVNRIPRRAGGAVSEDELLTTVTDTSEVLAYFRVSEREYLELAAKHGEQPQSVALRLADGTMLPTRGTIDAVGSELDPETGTLVYRARFANADGKLKHGSSGKVVIETDLRQALLVPQRSTFDVQGDYFVYVVDEQGVPHARKITVKSRVRDSFVIDSGLARTDRFVLDGVQKVRDGKKIDIVTAPFVATTASSGL